MALSRESTYPSNWLDWPHADYCEDEEWESHQPVTVAQLLPLYYFYNVDGTHEEYFCKDCLRLELCLVFPTLSCIYCGSHRIIRGKLGSLNKVAFTEQFQNYNKEMKNMARVVKIDFTGVEGGIKNVVVPAADYALEVVKVVGKKGKESGKPNLIFTFKLSEGPKKGNGKELAHNCSLQHQSLFNLKNLLEACGKKVPAKAISIDVDKLVGLKCAGSVVDGEYNDRPRSEIAFFFTLEEFHTASEGSDLEEGVEEAEEEAPKKSKKKAAGKKKGDDDMFGEETKEGSEEEATEEESEEDDLFS